MYEGTTIINVNSLLILESLSESERHTGTYLREDLEAELHAQGVPVGFATIETVGQFRDAMAWTRRRQAERSNRFILHIEAHGAKDGSGLLFLPSGNILPWPEFVSLCQEVNRECLNNLVVVLASCFGFRSILEVNIKAVTPFCTLIGSEGIVLSGLIEQEFPRFYRTLFATNDFSAAISSLDPRFSVYHAEQLLVRSFLGYLRAGCRGAGKRARLDRLLTELRTRHPTIDLTSTRRQLKALLRPDTSDYDRFKNVFLMADHPENTERFPSTLEDLLATV